MKPERLDPDRLNVKRRVGLSVGLVLVVGLLLSVHLPGLVHIHIHFVGDTSHLSRTAILYQTGYPSRCIPILNCGYWLWTHEWAISETTQRTIKREVDLRDDGVDFDLPTADWFSLGAVRFSNHCLVAGGGLSSCGYLEHLPQGSQEIRLPVLGLRGDYDPPSFALRLAGLQDRQVIIDFNPVVTTVFKVDREEYGRACGAISSRNLRILPRVPLTVHYQPSLEGLRSDVFLLNPNDSPSFDLLVKDEQWGQIRAHEAHPPDLEMTHDPLHRQVTLRWTPLPHGLLPRARSEPVSLVVGTPGQDGRVFGTDCLDVIELSEGD